VAQSPVDALEQRASAKATLHRSALTRPIGG